MEIREYDNEIFWLHKRRGFLGELRDSHIPKKYSIPWCILTVAYKKILICAYVCVCFFFPNVSYSNFSPVVGSTRKIQIGFQSRFSLLLS